MFKRRLFKVLAMNHLLTSFSPQFSFNNSFKMLSTPESGTRPPCKQAKDSSSQQHKLETVPADIHRLIMSELVETSPAALLNLARSSKALHDASIPFVYRNLVLSKSAEDQKGFAYYEAHMAKFKDASSDIAKHVRSITVESELPCEDLLLILEKISKCGRLRSFRYFRHQDLI